MLSGDGKTSHQLHKLPRCYSKEGSNTEQSLYTWDATPAQFMGSGPGAHLPLHKVEGPHLHLMQVLRDMADNCLYVVCHGSTILHHGCNPLQLPLYRLTLYLTSFIMWGEGLDRSPTGGNHARERYPH